MSNPIPITSYADGIWKELIDYIEKYMTSDWETREFFCFPSLPDSILHPAVVPTFEIVLNPTITISEIKARRFYIIDHAQQKSKEEIAKEVADV